MGVSKYGFLFGESDVIELFASFYVFRCTTETTTAFPAFVAAFFMGYFPVFLNNLYYVSLLLCSFCSFFSILSSICWEVDAQPSCQRIVDLVYMKDLRNSSSCDLLNDVVMGVFSVFSLIICNLPCNFSCSLCFFSGLWLVVLLMHWVFYYLYFSVFLLDI